MQVIKTNSWFSPVTKQSLVTFTKGPKSLLSLLVVILYYRVLA